MSPRVHRTSEGELVVDFSDDAQLLLRFDEGTQRFVLTFAAQDGTWVAPLALSDAAALFNWFRE